MDNAELDKRFTYHAPKEDQPERYDKIRSTAKTLAKTILAVCPLDCRETAVAVTKLEEVVFWANAAIARRSGL